MSSKTPSALEEVPSPRARRWCDKVPVCMYYVKVLDRKSTNQQTSTYLCTSELLMYTYTYLIVYTGKFFRRMVILHIRPLDYEHTKNRSTTRSAKLIQVKARSTEASLYRLVQLDLSLCGMFTCLRGLAQEALVMQCASLPIASAHPLDEINTTLGAMDGDVSMQLLLCICPIQVCLLAMYKCGWLHLPAGYSRVGSNAARMC